MTSTTRITKTHMSRVLWEKPPQIFLPDSDRPSHPNTLLGRHASQVCKLPCTLGIPCLASLLRQIACTSDQLLTHNDGPTSFFPLPCFHVPRPHPSLRRSNRPNPTFQFASENLKPSVVFRESRWHSILGWLIFADNTRNS